MNRLVLLVAVLIIAFGASQAAALVVFSNPYDPNSTNAYSSWYQVGGEGLYHQSFADYMWEEPFYMTDFHWWGSFKGWTRPIPPSIVPDYFMIGIWKDVPAGAGGPQYSHPRELIWAHKCDKWVWNYAGIDLDPRDRAHRVPDRRPHLVALGRERLGPPLPVGGLVAGLRDVSDAVLG